MARQTGKAEIRTQIYLTQDFSYTHATSLAVMERLDLQGVFAFDDHFRRYGSWTLLPEKLIY